MSAVAWSRRLILVVVGCFGVSTFAFASSNTGTITVGSETVCNHALLGMEIVHGFNSDTSLTGTFGSYSPTGLTGGTSVVAIWDNVFSPVGTACGTPKGDNSLLAISGFSVDPGQDWLSSITCNDVENTGSGAESFTYSGGTAIWSWSQLFGIGGSSVSCTISHS